MSSPKVSICIPAYKQPELLRKLLESILIQDYKDYEVVVTDDSPDSNVEDVCKDFLAKNLPIRYIKNIEKKGTPENWNEAIRQAKGEYIKIMHHDDWFLTEDALGKFVEMLDKNEKANFAFSGSSWFEPDGKFNYDHTLEKWEMHKLEKDPDILFTGNTVSTPSVIIFRKNIGIFFDKQFKWLVDLEFYMRAIKTSGIFEYIRKPLVGILVESNTQVTAECVNNKEIQIREYLKLYEKIKQKGKMMKGYIFKTFWLLFEKFYIKREIDIRRCGFQGEIPFELVIALWFRKNRIFSIPFIIVNMIMKVYSFAVIKILYGIILCIRLIKKER